MFSTRVCNCTLRFFSLQHGNMEACLPVIWWRQRQEKTSHPAAGTLEPSQSLPKALDWLKPYGILLSGNKSYQNRAIKSLAFPGLFIVLQADLPRPKLQTNFQLLQRPCLVLHLQVMNFFVQSLKRCLETVQLVQQGQSCRFSSSEEFFLSLTQKKSTLVICLFPRFCSAEWKCWMPASSLLSRWGSVLKLSPMTSWQTTWERLENDSVTLSLDFYAAIQTSLSRHKGFWPQNCLFISCTLLMDKQCLKPHPHLN